MQTNKLLLGFSIELGQKFLVWTRFLDMFLFRGRDVEPDHERGGVQQGHGGGAQGGDVELRPDAGYRAVPHVSGVLQKIILNNVSYNLI